MPTLLQENYFKDISEIVVEEFGDEIWKESILGIIMAFGSHTNTHNMKLLNSSVYKLKPTSHPKHLSAFISIVNKDPSQETNLKAFFKDLKVDTKLGFSLLQLQNNEDVTLTFKATKSIWNNYWQNPTLVSAFVSLLRKDLLNLKPIANSLGLDLKNTSLIMSWATKSKNIPFDEIAKKLHFRKRKAMEAIIRLAWGDLAAIKGLTYKNKKILTDKQYNLLEAIWVVMKENSKRRKYAIPISLRKLLKSSKVFAHTIIENINHPDVNFDDPISDWKGEEEVMKGSLKNDLEMNYMNKREYNYPEENSNSFLENSKISDYRAPKILSAKDSEIEEKKLKADNSVKELTRHINELILYSLGDGGSSERLQMNIKGKILIVLLHLN